jgi:hypothetical protein
VAPRDWLSTANTQFVNNCNGRSARATPAIFNGLNAKTTFADLDQMVKSGDTQLVDG